MGMENLEDESLKKSCYFMPVVCEVEPINILFKEETFGPIFPITRFKDEKEAIEIANSSEYGLAGAVMSKDIEKAQKIGKEIEVK